jgi:hypothetical protein
MNRRKRHPHILSAVFGALGCIGAHSYREPLLAPDGGGSGGGDAVSGGGGGAGSGNGDNGGDAGTANQGGNNGGGAAADVVPRKEFKDVISQRDRYKATQRATIQEFAEALGIDPDDVKIVETGNKDKPYKLEAPGLAEAATAVKEARTKKGEKWEDREKALNDSHQRKIQTITQTNDRKVKGLESFIQRQASVVPIQLAAAAEGAIDSEEGTAKAGSFADLVTLLQPRIKTEIAVDEDSGEARVTAVPLNDDGTPMLDKQGNPATIRHLVADFLTKKPHLRKAAFRPGSGAGGNGGAGSGGGQAPSSTAGKGAANAMFGKKPS